MTYLLFVLALFATSGQLFFLFGVFRKLAVKPFLPVAVKDTLTKRQVSVSVVICAHNECQNLQNFLPDILNQEYPRFEVVVVDDRSTDGTVDWLYTQNKLTSKLKVVRVNQTPAGWNAKKHALVQGVNTAQNEVVLLTDADCQVNSADWIKLMTQAFEQESIDIVLGFSPYFKHKGMLNWFIQFETFFTALQYLSFALVGKTYMGVGRNLAYRRKLFQNGKILGKHKGVVGGDDDLFINQVASSSNTSISVHPKAHVKSIPKTTWKSWYRQKLRHLSAGKNYQPRHHVLLGFLLFTQTLFWFSGFLGVIFGLYTTNKPIFEGIIFLFSLRMLVLLSIYKVIIRKLRIDVSVWWIPALDFLYIFYIFIIGTLAISRKRIKWT